MKFLQLRNCWFLAPHSRFKNFYGCHKTITSSYSTPTSINNFPSKCDAVIIGGGSIGCSTFYHLTKYGVKNVVLLERNKLTSGTTWHTAGLVWSLRPSDTDIQLLQITRDMLGRLETETGIFPGWNNNGGLFLASTKERLDEYKKLHTIGKPFGIESEVLSPVEAQKIVPILDPSTLYGTLYSSTDGNVDPSMLCNALTRFGTQNGGKVFEMCTVKGISTKESTFETRQVTGIDTDMGFIETPVVINCTGAWAPQITKMIDVKIPLVPMKHSYVVFERFDEAKGLPNIRDHDEGVYYRIQGDTISIGGYEMNPVILDQVEPDFAFGLYELDWDIFGVHVHGATKRIPKLKEVGIRTTICGPESFTPDHKPLMGEDSKVHGFFHGVGFNSAGMMFGGGCGSQLAKWVIDGKPELDMFSYDIKRFDPKLCQHKQWCNERSHESYAKNYSIVYKNDEPLSGRNQILSPFHSALVEKGCFYQERQGWERPGYFSGIKCSPLKYDWYGQYGHTSNQESPYVKNLDKEYSFEFPKHHENIQEECKACRTKAAAFDMSYFGKYFLTGPDAKEAAQWIFSNQMDRKPGSVIYTCFLNKFGGIEADLTATVLDENHRLSQDPEFNNQVAYYLAIGGTTSFYTFSTIQSELKIKGFNVNLINRNEDYGLLSVQGPKSREIMQELFDKDIFANNESFPFSTHQIVLTREDKIPIRAMRLSFVGEMGWELHVPKNDCLNIYSKLFKLGEKFGLQDAGYRAIDSLSIEKGYRHWHADIRSDDNPIEAGLAFTCKLKSDVDFLGRRALEEIKKKGQAKKKLVCFTIEDKETVPLWGLEAIFNEKGVPVGYLRRADYAHTIGKSIGYGYLPISQEYNIKDVEKYKWFIESMGKKYIARAHLKSPFDPQNKRVQGNYN